MNLLNLLIELKTKTTIKHTVKLNSGDRINERILEFERPLKERLKSKIHFGSHIIKTNDSSNCEIEFIIEVSPNANNYDVR